MQIQLRFHDSVTNLYTHKRSSFSVYRKKQSKYCPIGNHWNGCLFIYFPINERLKLISHGKAITPAVHWSGYREEYKVIFLLFFSKYFLPQPATPFANPCAQYADPRTRHDIMKPVSSVVHSHERYSGGYSISTGTIPTTVLYAYQFRTHENGSSMPRPTEKNCVLQTAVFFSSIQNFGIFVRTASVA